MEKCQEIFEKGLQAIPLSVDLWLQYINFTKSKVKDREDEVEQLRALYKRSVDVSCLRNKNSRELSVSPSEMRVKVYASTAFRTKWFTNQTIPSDRLLDWSSDQTDFGIRG